MAATIPQWFKVMEYGMNITTQWLKEYQSKILGPQRPTSFSIKGEM